MIKYIKKDNFGSGFITHEDQEIKGLSFSCIKDIVKIEGTSEEIQKWSDRVKGVEISEVEAIKQLEVIRITGIDNKISDLEKEIISLETSK